MRDIHVLRVLALVFSIGGSFAAPGQVILDTLADVTSGRKCDGSLNGNQAYEHITHPDFPHYKVRVKEPRLCDPTVQQYSGYLDVSEGRHLFFWFFESRTSPATSPVALWLQGGPGATSSMGLLTELGPCNMNKSNDTEWNPMSWNTQANLLFLDQPIKSGFSYTDDNSTVNTSALAAEDTWVFLQLFFQRYPKYSNLPFHIAGESYAGTMLPYLGSAIHKHNLEISLSSAASGPQSKQIINLHSLMIGNGFTSPHVQFASVPEYGCNGPYRVFEKDGPVCQELYAKVPICQSLIKRCQEQPSPSNCSPASLYCWPAMYGPFGELGLNQHDVRKKCNETAGDRCYEQEAWAEAFMNNNETKRELGADPNVNFQIFNTEVQREFYEQGDDARDTAALLPPLLEAGIRLLAYSGDCDFVCNYIGVLNWMVALDNIFSGEFRRKTNQPYVPLGTGKVAGEVRSAGGQGLTAGNLTYVRVYAAGHRVPTDQPEVALDMFVRWINDVPLT